MYRVSLRLRRGSTSPGAVRVSSVLVLLGVGQVRQVMAGKGGELFETVLASSPP